MLYWENERKIKTENVPLYVLCKFDLSIKENMEMAKSTQLSVGIRTTMIKSV